MTWAGYGGGAAIPSGWRAPAAFLFSLARTPAPADRAPLGRVDLLEPPFPLDEWPARDQGHRGACIAFAAVAAEELARYHEGHGLVPLSEERLHAAISGAPPTRLSIQRLTRPDPLEIGSRGFYLEQAMSAITSGNLHEADDGSFANDPLMPAHATRPNAPAGAKVTEGRYVHNIKEDNSPLAWLPPLPPGQTVVSVLHAALARKRPVAVTLPLFEVPGLDIFTGAEARYFGRVRYPDVQVTRSLRVVAGHAICLVGYEPGGPDGHRGWFVFRNSYGTHGFAHEVDRETRMPRSPAPGFGLISADDIEDWCLEYLHRD